MTRFQRKPTKNRLMSSATILAVGTMVSKALGALYRIPLTNVRGAEGMGMYQLVFPVFALFMVLSSAGIPTALSRVVAEKRALGEGVKRYLFIAMIALGALSLLSTILVATLSQTFALLQGNESVAVGFQVIAPSIFFVGLTAGFRGWFQGEMFMIPTSTSNVIEQGVKLAVGLSLAVYLKGYGIVWSVVGALAGVTLSEVLTVVYLAIFYFVRERKRAVRDKLAIPSKAQWTDMIRVALPMAVVALLLPLSNFVDSFIDVNVLKWSGADLSTATAEYGILSGPVTSLVNLPVVFIMSLAIAVVPSVSISKAERDVNSIIFKSKLSVKLAYTIGVPSAVFLMVFSKEVIGLLYSSLDDEAIATASTLLTVTAPNVVIMSVMQIYVSLLQALGKTGSAVRGLAVAVVVKAVLSVVLVGHIGIVGAGIASLVMGGVALIYVNTAFLRHTGVSVSLPIAMSLTAGVVCALSSIVPKVYIVHDILALVVGFVVCYIMYFFLSTLFGVLDKKEFGALPMGKIFVKLHKAIRFWEYTNGTQ